MFSKDIIDSVEILNIQYKTRRRYVTAEYPIIEINIEEKVHRVCFRLFYINDEYFEIQNPTYHYYSKISHYDFKTGESRWSRDKGLIFSVIRDLKICGLWDLVRNKDFIKINEHNDHSNRSLLQQELDNVLKEDEDE